MTTNRISIADPALRAESSPGRVEIAPYGEFEDKLASRPGGYLAVRFDLFFDVRYTITAIRFPSYTYDGAPATFPS
ncbi:MAG: hypothetical protein ACM3JJ_10425, partial [Hyphomicrobiales bacterium]